MTRLMPLALALAPLLLGASPPPAFAPGTYTNEEDRYFAAKLVGINLRWVQGSWTRGGAYP